MGQVFLRSVRSCLTIWTWGLAQYPYIVPPHLTIAEAASPLFTLQVIMLIILAGAFLLVPSLFYLFRVFKYRAVMGANPQQEIEMPRDRQSGFERRDRH